jgi:hypothetical protein
MKIAAAFLSLAAYVSFALANFFYAWPSVRTAPAFPDWENLPGQVGKLNDALNETVYGRAAFINLHGFLQRVMDKDESNNFEFVKDEQGFGHYAYTFQNKAALSPNVLPRMIRLKKMLGQQSRLTAILPPPRFAEPYHSFALGMPQGYADERADLYIGGLRENGIDYLDLRPLLLAPGPARDELFYKTDHHWTVEAGFLAYAEIAKFLRERYRLPIDDFFLDKGNYNRITYKDHYIGSMARKSGPIYLGVDDFAFIYPKFATNYLNTSKIAGLPALSTDGRFEESLVYLNIMYDQNSFDKVQDRYGAYLVNGESVHILNKNKPQGHKAVFIKDSFALPVAAFLAAHFSEIWLLDPRHSEKMEDFIRAKSPDHVFVMFSAETLDDSFFTFCAGEDK